MRAEADADEEWSVDMQLNGIADGVHRFAMHAYKYGKGIPSFFYANAFGKTDIQAVGGAAGGAASGSGAGLMGLMVNTHFLHHLAFFRPPGEVHHTNPVKDHHGHFCVIVKTLANNYHYLLVVLTFHIGE